MALCVNPPSGRNTLCFNRDSLPRVQSFRQFSANGEECHLALYELTEQSGSYPRNNLSINVVACETIPQSDQREMRSQESGQQPQAPKRRAYQIGTTHAPKHEL